MLNLRHRSLQLPVNIGVGAVGAGGHLPPKFVGSQAFRTASQADIHATTPICYLNLIFEQLPFALAAFSSPANMLSEDTAIFTSEFTKTYTRLR